MQQNKRLTKEALVAQIQAKLEQNDIFGLLDSFCQWLRNADNNEINVRLRFLVNTLKNNKALTEELAIQLCRWLCGMRLYPLLITRGLLSRDGFGRELRSRLYEKINPAFKDPSDLRDIFFLLFNDKKDVSWLQHVPLYYWRSLLGLITRFAGEHYRETVNNHLHYEGLFAIQMLSTWIAAEDMEPELMRLDPALLDTDSPFVALHREVMLWVDARREQREFDDSHLEVMFIQSQELVERLKRKGSSQGSSLTVAYLLERLEQTLVRLSVLMEVFGSNRFLPRRILLLTGSLAMASAEQHSVSKLWRRSIGMLSRTITQNTSDHGEHYITRDKKEYFAMFYSAAGGGVLIALMALLKIYLGGVIEDKVWRGIAEGLNYGIGFTIIFMFHFTVATKQPAMTASRFAESVGNAQGKAINIKLAQLLIDVFRSQSVAVIGNVAVAMSLAALIALGYQQYVGTPLLDSTQTDYQLHSIDPTTGTLWFSAIAGVWLFCSGIISGFFDNRCNYLNTRMRLQHHPLLKRVLSVSARVRFADYIHHNYGSIMGNFCFGMLLGLTGVVGYVLHLPLDIRHIAFSSANVGYAIISGNFSWGIVLQSVIFVLLIGIVNLIVSFSLTLWIALRSLNAEVESWKELGRAIWQLIKKQPLNLIFPVQLKE
ncbi:site-specific recombinase [Rodentibacter caecimuris]|uniref:Recombinase n=1 Tax=Rodentibacter caecimuris TaxID=1796644 RepID=A0ABX3KWX4_9PAST|nr:recombinase [Rodentibacter heylii]